MILRALRLLFFEIHDLDSSIYVITLKYLCLLSVIKKTSTEKRLIARRGSEYVGVLAMPTYSPSLTLRLNFQCDLE